ncbi:hypothetical protein QR680_015783 [Steinernema hermaphroditum]|uniref:Galectin n=1 Tax=Steinernema hermaphroditum TaxID=289476 RepID=A0AA39H8Y5_9BILA|nr:hypothetical protein QR680_015783 [Steinernema hermaphroditum]
MNSSTYGSELSGRGYVKTEDLLVGWSVIGLGFLQILFGAGGLWILKKVSIFHNAFGFLCAARTIAEMMSSLVHMIYSGPVTIMQTRNMSPLYGMAVGFLGYFFAALPCSLHVLMSINRAVSVYFPIAYQTLFRVKHCQYMLAVDVVCIILFVSPFFIIPCNTVGYSASHYGYVVLGCEDRHQERPFNYGRFLHYTCWATFCSGAIVMDCFTLLKILQIKMHSATENDKMFKRNVRFFAQSAFQNIPMFIDIALLSLGDGDMSEDKMVFRVVSFTLTRFTDLINALILIVFNPESRRYIRKIISGPTIVPGVIDSACIRNSNTIASIASLNRTVLMIRPARHHNLLQSRSITLIGYANEHFDVVTPFKTKLNGFSVPHRIQVVGRPYKGPWGRFTFNFKSDRKTIFHFNARFDENCIVMNNKRDFWQREERKHQCFAHSKIFTLDFIAEDRAISVYLDGKLYYKFNLRDSCHEIEQFEIFGEVEIHSVHIL